MINLDRSLAELNLVVRSLDRITTEMETYIRHLDTRISDLEKKITEPGKKIDKDDANFLWNLMPEWVKKDEPGLDPTMYGTGSYEGDLEIQETVRKILNNVDYNEQ